MAEPRGIDIHNLLKTGSFQTSRAKSPKLPKSPAERESQYFHAPPERVELHGYSSSAFDSSDTQRSSQRDRSSQRNRSPAKTSRRPPPPSVEDVVDTSEGEHAEEEAKSRGDVDQYPIIIDMHEYLANDEKRYVLVKDSEDAASPSNERNADRGVNDEYAANTGRKYNSEQGKHTNLQSPRPGVERKRSHQDLPRISTEFDSGRSRRPPGSVHRSRSRTKADDARSSQPDYFSPRYDPRQSQDGLLSPKIIKQGTRNREQSYYSYGRGQNGPPPALTRAQSADKRFDDPRTSHSSSPTARRHPRPEHERHMRRFSKERERSFSKERSYSRERSYSKERSGESPRRRPPGERRTSNSPPSKVRDKKSPSPPSQRQEREKLSRRMSSYKKRGSPPREKSGYSSDEEDNPRRSVPSYRRPKSIVTQEDRGSFLSPEGPRAPGTHSRSRSKSSATSPILPAGYTDFPHGPRSSVTFPVQRSEASTSSPYLADDASPGPLAGRRNAREPRGKSREPATMPIPIPIPVPAGPRDPIDKRRSGVPTPPDGRHGLHMAAPPNQLGQSWQPSPPKHSSWQPPRFNPETMYLRPDKPVGSFRRYSEDADRGGFPLLPDCPRKEGVVGMSDWLTLPRCENFNICPDCYNAVFFNSPFRNQLIPILWRPRDKKIVCDFGGSPWYRIAYLLTLKNRLPDLRLFSEIDAVASDVAAKNQECMGNTRAARIWYSIRNPTTQRIIPDFYVCYECIKTVEALLPNLRGVFSRLDATAEPLKAVCAMHFGAQRKRFVLYFDALETASDTALATGSPPNIKALAADLDDLVRLAECPEDKPVPNARWYLMEMLPEFTVCESCFQDVVAPRQSSAEPGSIVRTFYSKRLASQQTCQLYSSRMREVFRLACRTGDLKMLEETVLERRALEKDVRGQLAKLVSESAGDPRTEQAIDDLIQHWKRWE